MIALQLGFGAAQVAAQPTEFETELPAGLTVVATLTSVENQVTAGDGVYFDQDKTGELLWVFAGFDNAPFGYDDQDYVSRAYEVPTPGGATTGLTTVLFAGWDEDGCDNPPDAYPLVADATLLTLPSYTVYNEYNSTDSTTLNSRGYWHFKIPMSISDRAGNGSTVILRGTIAVTCAAEPAEVDAPPSGYKESTGTFLTPAR